MTIETFHCAICRDTQMTDLGVVTVCGHVFHYECIEYWNQKCPLCRKQYDRKDIVKIFLKSQQCECSQLKTKLYKLEETKSIFKKQILDLKRETFLSRKQQQMLEQELQEKQMEIKALLKEKKQLELKIARIPELERKKDLYYAAYLRSRVEKIV